MRKRRGGKLTTRLPLVIMLTTVAGTFVSLAAQAILDSTPVLPIKDAVETVSKRWAQEGFTLVKDFYDNLEDARLRVGAKTSFKVVFDTTPGREYVFAVTASNGATDLALSISDSEGAYSTADTRNIGNAYLRPPFISYPAHQAPTKVELAVELVRGTRNYAVPVAILVDSRMK